MRSPLAPHPARRLLLVVAGIGLALLGAEVLLRLWQPRGTFRGSTELSWLRGHPVAERMFVVDPAFGFRPIIDNDIYDRFGALRNEYSPAKPPGVTRLLFVGDSVTARGRIVAALRELQGEDGFEYWNAGVESFNTLQEVRYYETYNRGLHADHVVLTLHNNDFETTPIAFRDERGQLAVYAPQRPRRTVVSWLYEYSHLYRCYLGMASGADELQPAIVAEVEAALRRLRDLVAADGARFSLVVLPPLKPEAAWTTKEAAAYRESLRIAAALGLRCFDLAVPLAEAVRLGRTLEEEPGDPWHPHAETAALFARYLLAQGLLVR